MMGSMNESTLGSAAIVHFLPQLDFADADGPLLLAKDIAAGITYDYGKMKPTDAPGLGVVMNF